jgi:hypothetical protein
MKNPTARWVTIGGMFRFLEGATKTYFLPAFYQQTYPSFMNSYGLINCLVQSVGGCIAVVMDIRKKDKFYPLHEDQSRIMREIGFELDEYVIWDRQRDYNNMKTLGYPYVYRFNRVHEFICIYLKRKEVVAKPARVAKPKKTATKKAVKKAVTKKAVTKIGVTKKATAKKAAPKKKSAKI